ncbi:MAG: 30S ribosomal protein S13 [Candidatus Heimdallarchaeaceae archaeon]
MKISHESGFKYLVRVMSTDIKGELPIHLGLTRIKGVNRRLAITIARLLDISLDTRIGTLTDKSIKEIETILSDPQAHGVPTYMLNRRKDRMSGEDRHITEAQLVLTTKQDVERYIRTRSRRGIRHQYGLKVRGQRTRTHGKKGTTVGVSKKKK